MAADVQNDFWPDDGLPSKAEAMARRDLGIARAGAHADRCSEDWNDAADVVFRHYLDMIHGVPFLTEEFVAWARVDTDMTMPPDGRAWGGVIRRAALAHHIEKVGAAPANTSNRSLKCLWREVQP
jgi:hypothetical protein